MMFKDELLRLGSGFGSGMGTMEGTCGALVGTLINGVSVVTGDGRFAAHGAYVVC